MLLILAALLNVHACWSRGDDDAIMDDRMVLTAGLAYDKTRPSRSHHRRRKALQADSSTLARKRVTLGLNHPINAHATLVDSPKTWLAAANAGIQYCAMLQLHCAYGPECSLWRCDVVNRLVAIAGCTAAQHSSQRAICTVWRYTECDGAAAPQLGR